MMWANLLCAAALAGAERATPASSGGIEFFEKKVRPILVEHCYECHSSASKKVKGGLLLDTRDGVLKGGDNGPAIVPGDPEKSLLVKAVRYSDPDLQMPPKDKKLPDAQIADLAAWVRMGTPDPRTNGAPAVVTNSDMEEEILEARKTWAFQPPKAPTLPKVHDDGWIRSPVDRFILAQLEAKQLRPAPEADKRTLIRRATFDLTGLPPTIDEVNAFLADDCTNAFAKVVDRLLASPHYGERWARHWLDVVRYTDSFDARGIGGEGDVPEAYRYRDWVVNVFNDDLPYDQFITHQIAGDILATNGTAFDPKKLIATGVYVIGEWGTGDADKEKMLTDIVDDQVDLTGRAFLGLTLACARCHDHKFDPISTRDYYAMAGIFFSSHILPSPGVKTAGSPVLRLPLASPAEIAARKQREERIKELEKTIERTTDESLARAIRNLLAETERYLAAAIEYRSSDRKSDMREFAAAKAQQPELLRFWLSYLGDEQLALLSKPVKNVDGKAGLHAWKLDGDADTPSVTVNSTDQSVKFVTIAMPPKSLAVHPSPKAGVGVAWRSPGATTVEVSARLSDADANCGNGIEWTLNIRGERKTREIAKGTFDNGGVSSPAAVSNVVIRADELIELAILPRGAYECDTTVIDLSITEVAGQNRKWDLTREVVADLHAGNPHADTFGNPGVWHFFDAGRSIVREAPPGSLLAQWIDGPDRDSAAGQIHAAVVSGKFETNTAQAGLQAAYDELTNLRGPLANALRNDPPVFSPETQSHLATMRGELDELKKQQPAAFPVAHGLQEGGTPKSAHEGIRDARVHIRGRYDRLGDVVPRAFPRLLGGFDQPPIRNGSGRLELAKWIANAENALPARVMVNRLWQHHFGEGIVRTPNNYGKLGTPPTHPELLDYLATEFVKSGWSIKAMHRAIMLSAAYRQSSVPAPATLKADPENELFGRMNRRRLEAEAVRDSLLAVAGRLDQTTGGPAVRDLNTPRRTLYVMTVRSDRATYQSLFDAADPTTIIEKRTVSTVAPQALFLLNHPFALDQAKALAARSAKHDSMDARIAWLYQTLYARIPTPRERKLASERLGVSPEATAWERYCHVLLCANEFIYID
jgi:hypothetical protein